VEVAAIMFLTIGGLIGLAFYLQHRAEKARTARFAVEASEMQFTFVPRADSAFVDAFVATGCVLTSRGRKKEVKNLLVAQTPEAAVELFEYCFTTGGGKSTQHHRQTVARFRVPGLDLPLFLIRPRGWTDRWFGWMKRAEIAIAAAPEFAENFRIEGANPGATAEAITPRVQETLLSGTRRVTVEAGSDTILVYEPNVRIEPPAAREFLAAGFTIVAAFRDPQGEPA
jgi:hypothetical protein